MEERKGSTVRLVIERSARDWIQLGMRERGMLRRGRDEQVTMVTKVACGTTAETRRPGADPRREQAIAYVGHDFEPARGPRTRRSSTRAPAGLGDCKRPRKGSASSAHWAFSFCSRSDMRIQGSGWQDGARPRRPPAYRLPGPHALDHGVEYRPSRSRTGPSHRWPQRKLPPRHLGTARLLKLRGGPARDTSGSGSSCSPVTRLQHRRP